MSSQYSNSNYSYSYQPQLNYGSSTSTSSSIGQSMINKYPATSSASRYKCTELPWSSSLASTNRYPISSSSRDPHIDTNGRSGYASTSNDYASSRSNIQSSAISSTISGRCLFDYSTPRTAINTPASRIYDGQLRRTVTTKYIPGKYQPAEIKNPSSQTNKPTGSTTSSSSSSAVGQTCVSKPFRSNSLRLRASYTNILDQLATTTLAKLKLSSPRNSRNPSSDLARSTTRPLREPKLGVVIDESEEESTSGAQLRLRNNINPQTETRNRKVVTGSPGSTSSGLSSSGALGLSPTSSSSSTSHADLLRLNNCPPRNSLFVPEEKNNSDSGQSGDEQSLEEDTCIKNMSEEDEPQTVTQTVGRRLSYVSRELDADEDNLIRTGTILAELEK